MYTKYIYGFLIGIFIAISIALIFRLFYSSANTYKKDNTNVDIDENAKKILGRYVLETGRDSIDTKNLADLLLLTCSFENSTQIFQRLKVVYPNDSIWNSGINNVQKAKILYEIDRLTPVNQPTNNYYIKMYYKNDSTLNGASNDLQNAGFNIENRPSSNSGKKINSIWFNPNTDVNIIKIVALTLCYHEIELIDIRAKKSIEANVIEIGNEPMWENKKHLRNKLNYQYIINTEQFNSEFDLERIIK